MKKFVYLMSVLLIASIGTVAKADTDKAIRFQELPAKSQKFIHKYFTQNDIVYAKVERTLTSKSYEVVLKDGTNIDFDKKGEWTEVDMQTRSVPSSIVPSQIATYINEAYPTAIIEKISRNRRHYEVELSNRIEVKFDAKSFRVIKHETD